MISVSSKSRQLHDNLRCPAGRPTDTGETNGHDRRVNARVLARETTELFLQFRDLARSLARGAFLRAHLLSLAVQPLVTPERVPEPASTPAPQKAKPQIPY